MQKNYLEIARKLDAEDPLKSFRDQFEIDDPMVIYLDGNSLGRLPKATTRLLEEAVQKQWGKDLIDSWNKSWYKKNIEIGNKIAQLIGAEEGEVIISDNTSTNLYKLASAAIDFQLGKKAIVSDELNFPSDLYVLQGLAREKGLHLNLVKSSDSKTIEQKKLKSLLNQDVALLSLTHVAFKSAFMYDIEQITTMAHEAGALTLWDLSHSTGAVPLDMKRANVDMAVGCTYKYLNGGPGAPAFLYVRKDLQEKILSPIQGWFGASNPFDFSVNYTPEVGIRRFLTGTPPVLSLVAIEPGIDMILDAGMMNIRKKSIQLSEYFIELWKSELRDCGFELSSPLNADHRGSHISISHKEAFRITKALMDRCIDDLKVIPDFRSPDNIRLGFAPLYNTFEELFLTVKKLKSIVDKELFLEYDLARENVT